MMEIGRVESVPSLDRNPLMYNTKLEHSFETKKTSTLRSELTNSFGIDAQRVVELDLYPDDDESEDEGEIMLLAMILLQLHGVKFPGGFPTSDHNNKKKRQRTSPDQLAILEQIFQTDKMPSQQTRVQLADQLGMSSRRVQIWFQNKRAKVKRGLGKSSEGIQLAPDSPLGDSDSRDGFVSLSSSSCLSEPESSSPLVPDSFLGSSSPSSSTSSLSSTPPSPNSPALVPSSPSLSPTPKQLYSLSSLAQPLSSEFSAPSLLKAQGV